MKLKLTSFLITVALLCAILTACKGETAPTPEKLTQTYYEYFDTVTTVVGYEDNSDTASFDAACAIVEASFEEYNKLYDIYKTYSGVSNIKTINDNAGVSPVHVDQKIIDLLDLGLQAYELTGGMANIAMGSLLGIWHDYREAGIDDPASATLPPMEMLENAALHMDICDVIIDRENNTVYLSDPDMSLDVGAVAKGYATEMVSRQLTEAGYNHIAINAGGNVRTIGTKADGEDWAVGIQTPDEASETGYFMKVALSGKSLVTSGSYQRYYTVEEQTYHHIINPTTLMPENNFVSVSVIGTDSGIGDVLSTALFNMPYEGGLALIESLDNTEAVWLYPDGTYVYSSGIERLIVE